MKIKKILKILILIMVIIGFATNSFAADITNGIDINKDRTKVGQFENIGNKVFGIVRVAGIVCSVGALMLLGIKYMLGSVEEKAEYKKTFPIYLTGCILVFGISTLVEIVYDWVESLPI